MTFSEQLADFNAFAERFVSGQGDRVTLGQVYDLWWEHNHRDDDLAAVLQAHAQYESGERGVDAFEALESFRLEKKNKDS